MGAGGRAGGLAGCKTRLQLCRTWTAGWASSAWRAAGLAVGINSSAWTCASTRAERLSLAWRQWLTGHLHACYCGDGAAAYFLLQQPGGKPQEPQEQQQQQQQQGQHAHGNGGETGTHERAQLLPQHAPAAAPHGDCKGQQQGDGQQRGGGALDNPDQRIASDAAELCESLSVVARVAAAAPFKLLYYRWGLAWLAPGAWWLWPAQAVRWAGLLRTPACPLQRGTNLARAAAAPLPPCRSWLTCGYLGWRGLGAVYAFFWVAAAVQR